jgi:hypothetical protein
MKKDSLLQALFLLFEVALALVVFAVLVVLAALGAACSLANLDFFRAAEFLCKTPLDTARSITLYAAFKAEVKVSPPAVAASAALLRTVRTAERQDLLRSWLRSVILTRFMADLILGTMFYAQGLTSP